MMYPRLTNLNAIRQILILIIRLVRLTPFGVWATLVGTSIWGSTDLYAGFLLAPRVGWESFSFRSQDESVTPNYYALGGGLSLGYSIAQQVELAGFVRYSPGNVKVARFMEESASVVGYGAESALRFWENIYCAARVGEFRYVLIKQNFDSELDGRWLGVGYGGSLGGFFKMRKPWQFQMSLDFHHLDLKQVEPQTYVTRGMDIFSVSIGVVMMTQGDFLGGGALSDFLRSLTF